MVQYKIAISQDAQNIFTIGILKKRSLFSWNTIEEAEIVNQELFLKLSEDYIKKFDDIGYEAHETKNISLDGYKLYNCLKWAMEATKWQRYWGENETEINL